MEIEIKTKEEYKEKYGKLWGVVTELDESFKNCDLGLTHLSNKTVEPFFMDFPVNHENESECQFDGLVSIQVDVDSFEQYPVEISEIAINRSLKQFDSNGWTPFGWFGGFENCIINNTIFETVEYSLESWFAHGINDSFYNVDWNMQPKFIELFLPHLCHSRISNSKICYMMGDALRHKTKMAASIKNGAAVPPGFRAVHDQVRVGNASQYINCHIKIRPKIRNAPSQPNCKAVFYSCYFENCTFDIHKRSNVEFTNCVFV